ncbi:unnamed protein product [Linum tenue]|uniref:Survival Motor Neuron Gemin2-binding domain-containing protein n=1 Tax=Linum tenue TaxID=586396 RepID=A0AAV0PPR1_9ROSI|nr:unnamed protein product [Linum tenue]CAI0473009.1 unnamed protein product [Linum tenue]
MVKLNKQLFLLQSSASAVVAATADWRRQRTGKMGKGDELWDDSALLNAFDDAISKYKKYHGKKGQENSADSGKGLADSVDPAPVADEGLGLVREVEETGKVASQLTAEINDRLCIAPSDENYFAYQLGDEQNIDTANDVNAPTVGDHSNVQATEDYNELLSQYYDLEEKRQKVLEQLQQLGGYYYQDPAEGSSSAAQLANCSTSQDHSAPATNQTHGSATCIYTTCCPYASHCPVVSCCGSKLGTDSTVLTCCGKACPLGESDMVKTAMEAAERAMSSIKGKSSDDNCVKDEEEEGTAQGPTSGTDLCDVLNAWYLTEQSMAKK